MCIKYLQSNVRYADKTAVPPTGLNVRYQCVADFFNVCAVGLI